MTELGKEAPKPILMKGMYTPHYVEFLRKCLIESGQFAEEMAGYLKEYCKKAECTDKKCWSKKLAKKCRQHAEKVKVSVGEK